MGAVLIGMVLIASQLALSLTSPVTVIQTAPFSGKPYLTTVTGTWGCNIIASIWKAPTMNLTSGLANAGVKAHAKSCPAATGVDSVLMTVDFGLYAKSFTTTSGPHKVTVHWKVTWNTTLAMHAAPAVLSYPSALSTLRVVAVLDDLTSATYLYPSNSWQSDNNTLHGNVSYRHSATVSIFFNQTLVAGHVYSVESWLDATVYVIVPATGTSTADANLNLATFGNGAKLTSIVLS